MIVMHETTELRRLESLRRDFVANVSHELKTPLSSIKAYAETLRNGALDDREASVTFVERIQEQADRLHHLILDMLSLARIESAQQVFEIVPVSVQEVVDACFDEPSPGRRCQADRTRRPSRSSRGCFVRADKEGLREILDNLVDNAIKYTPEGGKRRRSAGGARRDRQHGDDRSRGHRHRHRGRRVAAGVRAVLSRRQGPLARAGRHRPGPGDREAPGPVVRRQRVGRQRNGRGQHVPVDAAACLNRYKLRAFCVLGPPIHIFFTESSHWPRRLTVQLDVTFLAP